MSEQPSRKESESDKQSNTAKVENAALTTLAEGDGSQNESQTNRIRKDTLMEYCYQGKTFLPYGNQMLLGLNEESMHTRSKHYLDANYDDEKYREVLIQYIRKTGKDKLIAIDDIDDFLKPPQRIVLLDNTLNPPAPLVIEDPTMEILIQIANEVGLKPLPQSQIPETAPEPLKTIAERVAKSLIESVVNSVVHSEPVAEKSADQPVKSDTPAEGAAEPPVKSVASSEAGAESPVKSIVPSESICKTLAELHVKSVAAPEPAAESSGDK